MERDDAGVGFAAAFLTGSFGMIQITPQMRVLVAIEPVDGCKGIDSLAWLCQKKLPRILFRLCFHFPQPQSDDGACPYL